MSLCFKAALLHRVLLEFTPKYISTLGAIIGQGKLHAFYVLQRNAEPPVGSHEILMDRL